MQLILSIKTMSDSRYIRTLRTIMLIEASLILLVLEFVEQIEVPGWASVSLTAALYFSLGLTVVCILSFGVYLENMEKYRKILTLIASLQFITVVILALALDALVFLATQSLIRELDIAILVALIVLKYISIANSLFLLREKSYASR